MANYFPLFADMEKSTVLIFGGGEKAQEKIKKLKDYSPAITVAAPSICKTIRICCDVQIELCSFSDAEDLLLRIRPQFVIIADVNDENIPLLFALSRKYRIPVNTVDKKDYCTFIFPSIIKKKNLTVAVSTQGTSPAAAKYLREEIEKAIPSEIEPILDWIATKRNQLRTREDLDQAQSAVYQRALVAYAFQENRPPNDMETEEILQKYKKT